MTIFFLMIKRKALLLSTFLFLLTAPAFVFSQTGAGRVRTYDVQHYILRSSFDRASKTYFGDATVRVKPLAGNFKSLALDAAGLKFESVSLETGGAALKYAQAGGKITVALDRAYAPNEEVSVRFKYTAQPQKGVYFVDE